MKGYFMNPGKMLKRQINNLPADVKNRNDGKEIQVSFLFEDGHIHHLMPEDSVAKVLTEDVATHISLPLEIGSPATSVEVKENSPPDQVVLHNRQAFGDILTMTCAIRDFKAAFPKTRLGVITTASHIWDHNPYIDHTFRDEQHVVKIGPGFLTNKSNYWNLHMCNAFRMDIEQKLKISIPQGIVRPDIWMTEAEIKRPPLIDGAYWLFVYGGEPGWTAKQYHRWQEVINILKGKVQFVQIGAKAHPYPLLDNVINYVGKTEDRHTGIRDLFNLFYHAQGTMGLVSMHMHLSAAFNNPCVVLAAAREPAWFTQYFGHQYIQTNGTMACAEKTACWKCDVKACRNLVNNNLPKCVEIIEPEELAEGVLKYYKGGRLQFGKKIPNTFFKNIAKESKTFSVGNPQISLLKDEEKVLEDSKLTFGGGSLTDKDWTFIKRTLSAYKVKEILEFGAGLSSLLFETLPEITKIYTFETHEGWIKKIRKLSTGKIEVIQWDGKDIPNDVCGGTCQYPNHFTFSFVDGPSGGASREWSTKYASEHSDIIVVHDAGRDNERMWQERYLVENFQLISKGGHRCHLWKRKTLCTDKDQNIPLGAPRGCCAKQPVELNEVKLNSEDPTINENNKPIEIIDGKLIARMITTCRGFGGSERSSINIMKMFQDKGFSVILTPTGNISNEYGRSIPNGVQISKWDSIPFFRTNITVLYCSDTIWNYNNDQYKLMMPQLNTERKVMVVNYKVGGVGQINWTKNWDKYLFLSSQHKDELLIRLPDAKTKVMAPPTDLTSYYLNSPDYSLPLKLIRHNSQGDSKHHPDTNKMIQEILSLAPETKFYFMPAKSDCMEHENIHKHPKNVPPVNDFLKLGNCFWYRLPDGYTEGGPKVIMEAQASGLACIVDNHSGPKDRVNETNGWVCNNWNDYIEAIKEILSNPKILEIKGQAAREWAMKEYSAEKWIEEILND
jgi:ADP-heptose:LPS heptosyltransferase